MARRLQRVSRPAARVGAGGVHAERGGIGDADAAALDRIHRGVIGLRNHRKQQPDVGDRPPELTDHRQSGRVD